MVAIIRAVIDGFTPPCTLTGWATKRVDGKLLAGLRIEARRTGETIASATPDHTRPDINGEEPIPVAFTLHCPPETDLAAILNEDITFHAIDPGGETHPILFWAPTREILHQTVLVGAMREAGPELTAKLLNIAATRPELAHEATQLQKFAAKLTSPRAAPGSSNSTGPKITLIGAGSTVFAKNLIGDILLHPALSASRIYLYDIDPERLRVSQAVANRINTTLGGSATIIATLELREALDNADFAITMIQVGGYEPSTLIDFEIPKRFGLRQTIADTLGIGGIMRALRTIPVLLNLTREMERYCPNVIHLNYANPMAMNCWALTRASPIRTYGLCHSVRTTAAELARDLGLPAASLSYQVAGINHMAFFLKLEAQGQNLYPQLHTLAASNPPAHDLVRYDLLTRFGYFVTESSEHFAEYVPWYIRKSQPDLVTRLNIPLDEYPSRCRQQIADWQTLSQTLLDPSTPLAVQRSHEYASEIIHAITTGEPAVVYANLPNAGHITNLPQGCCVELPCLVDHNGIQPTRIGTLPPQLAALMQTNINVQSLTVEAALTGRRDHIYHAALLDPHTAAELSADQITDLVDTLLDAHRDWLPAAFF